MSKKKAIQRHFQCHKNCTDLVDLKMHSCFRQAVNYDMVSEKGLDWGPGRLLGCNIAAVIHCRRTLRITAHTAREDGHPGPSLKG